MNWQEGDLRLGIVFSTAGTVRKIGDQKPSLSFSVLIAKSRFCILVKQMFWTLCSVESYRGVNFVPILSQTLHLLSLLLLPRLMGQGTVMSILLGIHLQVTIRRRLVRSFRHDSALH
jgi:hypothetical protein